MFFTDIRMRIALSLAALCTVQLFGKTRAEDNFRSSCFNIKSKRRLVGHVIATTTADSEISCAHKCLTLDGCKSGNFRTSVNKQENCELSSRGLLSRTHDPDLGQDDEFVFIYFKNVSYLTTIPCARFGYKLLYSGRGVEHRVGRILFFTPTLRWRTVTDHLLFVKSYHRAIGAC